MEDIKDLRAPGWGQIKGGVSFSGDGLVTDGVNGEVLLNHEGETCATKSAYANCDDPGFTVSLSLKPWYKTDGARQTFFKSRGKFIVYQERGKKSLIIRVQGSAQYCLKEIAMPEKIWSHLAFTYKPSGPKHLQFIGTGKESMNLSEMKVVKWTGSQSFLRLICYWALKEECSPRLIIFSLPFGDRFCLKKE